MFESCVFITAVETVIAFYIAVHVIIESIRFNYSLFCTSLSFLVRISPHKHSATLLQRFHNYAT